MVMPRERLRVYAEALENVAGNVARLRAERGFSQSQLGAQAGLHTRHIQMILAGDVNMTLETLAKLASALEVDVADLLRKEGRR